MKRLFTLALGLLLSLSMSAQMIKGTVVDSEYGDPLIGASVLIKGSTIGTITDIDGNFSLDKPADAGNTVVVSYLGYSTMEINLDNGMNLGTISLQQGMGLDELVITGVVDIAKDRRTPVAVSTLRAADIAKLGNQELPELLNATPSVYATKSGGGYGDSRINIRGFDQTNTAVLINGVPVNDMENGAVYWSNWAGLADVTTAMQVQRGLGSSKLAISSVGGTINVLTKTTDKERGGAVSVGVGNDGYLKTLVSYSSGKNESGFASSVLLSRTSGDGYVTGTKFEGYNYFLGLGWDKGKNNFQFTVTGAPQVHNQRTTSFYNMATLADYRKYGNKYNYNHGTLNGEEFNWRRNFYHKPIASLNWDLQLNEKSKLSTVVYASFGRGGGTGDIGRLGGRFNFASDQDFRDANGEVMWDKIVASNGGTLSEFNNGFSYANSVDGETGQYIVNDPDLNSEDVPGATTYNGIIRRASMNSHNWVGVVSNFNHKINDKLNFDIGIDARKYKGIHYRRVDNLLGADGYRDVGDEANGIRIVTQENESNLGGLWNVFKSIDDDEKINYYNDGLVNWLGAFSQLEYLDGPFSAFVQGSVSQQGFKRIDYFRYAVSDSLHETEYENIMGGNIKAGANYNINENNNVFFNAGYYSKQPKFDAVYENNDNYLNEEYVNEEIVGLELGYGYIAEDFRANVNVYRTTWSNRFLRVQRDVEMGMDEVEATANIQGVKQVHMGFELDASYQLNKMFRFNAMLSLGNWEYDGIVSGDLVDDNQNVVGVDTLYLKDVKVGDAAQTTYRLSVEAQPIDRLFVDLSFRNASNLYAAISADAFNNANNNGSLELPSYSLFDLGVSYKHLLGDNNQSIELRVNVNNLFDTEYIAESATNIFAGDGDEVYNGINTRNKVFFGFGRTWNTSIRYNF